MANAVAITRAARTKSVPDYTAHILRQRFVSLLEHIDRAVEAERQLTWATDGQPGGMCDPSVSVYLRDAENAWDKVTDRLSAATAAAAGESDCALRRMVFCLRAVLSSETADEFNRELAAARRLIAETCVLPNASVAERDFYQVLQAVASRLDALDSIDLYRSGTSEASF